MMDQWWFWPLLIWSFIWKGFALWRSAQLGSKKWFVALLIFNTAGILEIFYIFVFSKKKTEKGPIV
ncbi:MAG TPA: hypothetical protein ENH26_00275 [Candidatus Wolfebacteria bacterium]|nr:hypothetical protein [Candidatus Moranbacteria bacterium]HDH31203.1 hypothetical protein [Candidatus Wolfebacteria bacterium]